MPLGKLVLKGGQELVGIKKKKKKSKKSKTKDNDDERQGQDAGSEEKSAKQEAGTSGGATGKEPAAFLYEKEFQFETQRMDEGKARSTAWGATYRAPPEILHGYSRQVKGDTFEERLDLRCAKKADRMCK